MGDEKDDDQGISHLSNLKTVEVSYVPRGAIRKKFLILKEDDQMPLSLQQRIAATRLKNQPQIVKVLKDSGMGAEDSEALQSALRVLTSLGDQVSPELLGQLGQLCGVQMADYSAPPAAPVAMAATPPPPAQPPAAAPNAPAQHTEAPAPGGAAPTHTPPPHAPAAAAPAAPAPQPHQARKEDEKKEDGDEEGIMKADGTLDESKIPAPLRATVVKLWQSSQDTAAIKKQLDAERDVRVTKEYQERAAGFAHLPGTTAEQLGPILKELALTAPDVYGKVEPILKAANDLIKKSAFAELGATGAGGSPAGAGDGSTTYAMIEQAAMQTPIAKGQGLSKEAATTAFITKTAEGRRMYADYVKGQNGKK